MQDELIPHETNRLRDSLEGEVEKSLPKIAEMVQGVVESATLTAINLSFRQSLDIETFSDEISQDELRERFEALREKLGYKKYQMADLLGIGKGAYEQKTNSSSEKSRRSPFSKSESRLLWFIETYGIPEGYIPPARTPGYTRQKVTA